MSKGQLTADFLFCFLFYLVFLSLILSSIRYYTLAMDNSLEKFNGLLTLEETARIMDSYYLSDSHFSIRTTSQYLLKDNLLYEINSSLVMETLYSGEELYGEAT